MGNDYTYCGTFFTAGYIIGQIPAALLLSSGRIPARMVFVAAMVCWGFVTLGTACASDPTLRRCFELIYRSRHFRQTSLGLPIPHRVLRSNHFLRHSLHFGLVVYRPGAWETVGCGEYHADMPGLTCQFVTSSQIGSTFSGVMQGAIVTTLGGKHGLAGWQWLFIIDFAVTSMSPHIS